MKTTTPNDEEKSILKTENKYEKNQQRKDKFPT